MQGINKDTVFVNQVGGKNGKIERLNGKKKKRFPLEEKGSMIIGQRQGGGKACRNSIGGNIKKQYEYIDRFTCFPFTVS